MEITHSEGGGGDHLTVGVEITNDDEDFWPQNFIPGEQMITLEYEAILEEFSVAVWGFAEESEMYFQIAYTDEETGEITS